MSGMSTKTQGLKPQGQGQDQGLRFCPWGQPRTNQPHEVERQSWCRSIWSERP